MTLSINIQQNSRIPKYRQLAHRLIERIKNNTIRKDEPLPSINVLSARLDVSRDTVEKAYRELKRKNLIEAVPGKGYYVKHTTQLDRLRIFLLFNKLSAHKKIIYDSFVETIGPNADLEFHIYNNDFTIFEKLLSHNTDNYTHYVIIPHFFRNYHLAKAIINRIPKEKLVLLDKKVEGIQGKYTCIYQDFEQNIYSALSQAIEPLRKYQELKLLFPSWTYQPREIINGFQRFCIDFNFKGKLVPEIEKEPIHPGEAYITMMEDDLVTLVKKIKKSGLQVGQQVGILSYNENPLKEVLLDGISVISTDFKLLGQTAANMILNNQKAMVENPFHLILRKSI